MKVMMDGANKMEDELQKLYSEVNRIIEEGDLETARRIVEENYDALVDSLGDVVPPGVEQAAMLDILAQLRLSLGDTNEAEKLLEQVCEACLVRFISLSLFDYLFLYILYLFTSRFTYGTYPSIS